MKNIRSLSRTEKITWLIRLSLGIMAICVAILVFGPFQGLETQIGLNDKEAHIAAFYALCTLGMIAAPRIRRTDIGLVLLCVGALIEVVQAFTGRSADLGDWLCDALGISLALIPTFLEQWRAIARKDAPIDDRRDKDELAPLRPKSVTPKLVPSSHRAKKQRI